MGTQGVVFGLLFCVDCLSPVCCCSDPSDCLICAGVVLAALALERFPVRNGWRVFLNAEKEFVDHRKRTSRKGLGEVRSRLMEGRSGRVNSAWNQMCGRGGAAGVATMTSQRGCVGSTGRRLPQGMKNGLRAPRTSSGKWQKIRSFRQD